jgi:acetyl-CoA/propionyl-CoA carboxylase biotin carboxyl carrier protein
MNTRLQVEHPVTELVTGRDLVADQLRVAAGEALGFENAAATGHAVEVRLYAEDAEDGFLPATGRVEALRWPGGDGIRVDAGIEIGTEIGGRFDPMLAKIVAWGDDRRSALERLTGALDETVVLGLTTNLRFLRWLVRQAAVIRGDARIDTLDAIWHPAAASDLPADAWIAAAAALGSAGWRLNAAPVVRLVADDGRGEVERSVVASAAATARAAPTVARLGPIAFVDVDGRSVGFRVAAPPDVDRAARAAASHARGGGSAEVSAPMPGAVLAVHVSVGDAVAPGDPIATLEAMKMEHVVIAGAGGRVVEVRVRPGKQVVRGQALATIEG